MKKTICSKCNNEFRNKGGCYARHFKACNGVYVSPKKLSRCKYCELLFDELNTSQRANHSRWCVNNPKRNSFCINLHKVRNCKRNFRNQYTKAKQEGRKVPVSLLKGRLGTFIGKVHSKETKQKMRDRALESSHRRLKKGSVIYKGVLLDSSWELELAKRLDNLGIDWIRPAPIKWLDAAGIFHNYFPDFYLPKYDLYLDPKNPWACSVQRDKLKILLFQHKNIQILITLQECRTFKPPE